MNRYWRITLVTNPDACNEHCTLCFLAQRGKSLGLGEMPWDVAERAVRSYAAQKILEVIPSTMGEPLLYTHFEKLESLVQELHLKLNLTTNGSFPFKGAANWAKELLPISSDIKVSCWGVNQKILDTLCPGVRTQTYIQNLRTLSRVREELRTSSDVSLSKLSLQMAVCKTNREEVDRVLDLAEELGFDRVKLNHVVFLSSAVELRAREALSGEEFWNGEVSRRNLRIEGSFLYPEENVLQPECCPFLGRELWILPDGSTEPCPDPENRYIGRPKGKKRCEICHLFPKKFTKMR